MKKENEDPQKEIVEILKSIRKDVKEKFNKIDSTVDDTVREVKKSSKIKYLTLGFTAFALLVNAVVLCVAIRQLNEMSRKPELYLEVRDIDPVNTTYNKINYKAIIFRCNLFNSGNAIAKDIQINHRLDVDPALSISVTSTEEDDFTIYYTGGDELVDTTIGSGFPFSEKSVEKFDTLYFKKTTGDTTKVDTHYFEKTNENAVLMQVYKYHRGISFGRSERRGLKLHFIWLLSNVSEEINNYYIPYTITSDKGSFEDIMKIKNPFYKK
ncbi:hypothetical protein JW879_08130 [candidate division WOR-3 bacterium]|nr:hypothetical protein [candidate division WOR-3 bacterium]